MLDEEINPRQLRQINEMQWKQLWNIAYQEDVSETKLVVSKEFEKKGKFNFFVCVICSMWTHLAFFVCQHFSLPLWTNSTKVKMKIINLGY